MTIQLVSPFHFAPYHFFTDPSIKPHSPPSSPTLTFSLIKSTNAVLLVPYSIFSVLFVMLMYRSEGEKRHKHRQPMHEGETALPGWSTKTKSDSDIWAPTDAVPIREGEEQTERQGHGAVKRVIMGRDRIAHRDQERRQYKCHVNVWSQAVWINQAGRGDVGEKRRQTEARKQGIKFVGLWRAKSDASKQPL